jgi:glutamine transport system substrate-binding protein
MQRRTLLETVMFGTAIAGAVRAQTVTVTVGVDSDNKPFVFNRDGKLVGFSAEIWEEIAEEAHITFKTSSMDFSALIPALQTGNIDVAYSSIFITAARKAVIDFSDPYFTDSTGVLIRAGSGITAIRDLASRKVVSVTGTAQVAWIKQNLPNAEQTQLPNVAAAFLALAAERVDAVFYDYPTLGHLEKFASTTRPQ